MNVQENGKNRTSGGPDPADYPRVRDYMNAYEAWTDEHPGLYAPVDAYAAWLDAHTKQAERPVAAEWRDRIDYIAAFCEWIGDDSAEAQVAGELEWEEAHTLRREPAPADYEDCNQFVDDYYNWHHTRNNVWQGTRNDALDLWMKAHPADEAAWLESVDEGFRQDDLAELASLVDTWAYTNVTGSAVLTVSDQETLEELRDKYPEDFNEMFDRARAKHHQALYGVGADEPRLEDYARYGLWAAAHNEWYAHQPRASYIPPPPPMWEDEVDTQDKNGTGPIDWVQQMHDENKVAEYQCSFCWRFQGEQHMALCINSPFERESPSVPRAVAEWVRNSHPLLEEQVYNVVDKCYCTSHHDEAGVWRDKEPDRGCDGCRGTGLWPHRMTLFDMIVGYVTA